VCEQGGPRNGVSKTQCPDKLRLLYCCNEFMHVVLCLWCYILAGAGMYVSNTQLSYSSSSLHNNSIITSYTGSVYYLSSYTRMSFYCCSNSSTSGSTATFIGLNGNSYSGQFGLQRYDSSSSYAGCMYISLYKAYRSSQNYLSTSEEGIYTCRMPDSTGRNTDVSVGIYRHGYTCKFIVHI